jgi:cysteine desulfurase/selenocysteine lyase
MLDRQKIEKIREDFPALKREVNGYPLIYFDSAATSLKPKQVIEAVNEYNEFFPANVHRAVHTLSYEATEKYILAHKKVAEFIGARSWREVIFTKNATEAANLLAYSLGLHIIGQKDKIITTIMEHHSNLVPWQFVAKYKGAEIFYVDINDDGTLKEDELIELVDEKTKIVSLTGASNVLGYTPDIRRITREIKKKNADVIVIIDCAQLLPHKKIDVKEIGCDFIFASGHKMLGPSGTGFLWGKEELLEKIEPFMYGGDMISKVTLEGADWNELPFKFEAGTPNISGGIGLGKAVEYLSQYIYALPSYEHNLLKLAYSELKKIKGVRLYIDPSNNEKFVGVISFNVEGVHPHDIAEFLDKYGIAVRSGHHCAQPLMARLRMQNSVRISFHIYNTEEEIMFFVEILKKAVNLFSA